MKEKLKQCEDLKELQKIAQDTMLFRPAVKALSLKELINILDKLELPYPDDELTEFLTKELTKKLQEHLIKIVLS